MLALAGVGFKGAARSKESLSRLPKSPIYNVMQARVTIATVAVLGLCTRSVQAQRPTGTVEISGVGVWHTKTLPHDALRAFGAGARLGIWVVGGLEVEGEVDLTFPRNFATGVRYTMTELGLSGLYNYTFEFGPSIYVRAGFTKIRAEDTCRVGGGPCNAFGALTGGGGFRVPITGPLQFRAEGTYKTRSAYEYNSVGASVGLTVFTNGNRLRGARAEADDDGDGVPNSKDRCPDTVRGALVDSRGCPTDTDGDGVPDGIDRCPGTPKGTPVDAFGCPMKKPE